jgi:hypothetical protein
MTTALFLFKRSDPPQKTERPPTLWQIVLTFDGQMLLVSGHGTTARAKRDPRRIETIAGTEDRRCRMTGFKSFSFSEFSVQPPGKISFRGAWSRPFPVPFPPRRKRENFGLLRAFVANDRKQQKGFCLWRGILNSRNFRETRGGSN